MAFRRRYKNEDQNSGSAATSKRCNKGFFMCTEAGLWLPASLMPSQRMHHFKVFCQVLASFCMRSWRGQQEARVLLVLRLFVLNIKLYFSGQLSNKQCLSDQLILEQDEEVNRSYPCESLSKVQGHPEQIFSFVLWVTPLRWCILDTIFTINSNFSSLPSATIKRGLGFFLGTHGTPSCHHGKSPFCPFFPK